MFLQDYICVLCNANVDESLNHLCFGMPICCAMLGNDKYSDQSTVESFSESTELQRSVRGTLLHGNNNSVVLGNLEGVE